MAAGLYDRAEDMFSQLVDETDFRIGALQQLLQIYQATSDWQKRLILLNGWSNSVKTNSASKLPTSIASWLSSRWVAMTWIKPWHC